MVDVEMFLKEANNERNEVSGLPPVAQSNANSSNLLNYAAFSLS
jgi:hypothetical protein